MAERDLDQLSRISTALDGEGPMPEPLDADGAAFLAASERLRSRFRVEEAVTPPDVTDAVLDRVRTPSAGRRRPERSLVLVAAAVFAVAALVTGLLVRSGGPLGPEPALADVGDDVLEAQTDVAAMEADLTLVERGAHPDRPDRRYEGTLRYDAPERLWLHLEEISIEPGGWPTNDVDLVIDEQTAWTSGLHACPVGQQPACLGSPQAQLVTGAAPFAADHVAPLDLVIPAGAFLPSADVSSSERDDAIVVETTVARLDQAIDGLRAGGALRAVHPTDAVRLVLDRETFTIRRLTVTAGDAPSRTTWAATNGYTETPGTAILDLHVEATDLPDAPFPDPPTTPGRDAGFVDRATVDAPHPRLPPAGLLGASARWADDDRGRSGGPVVEQRAGVDPPRRHDRSDRRRAPRRHRPHRPPDQGRRRGRLHGSRRADRVPPHCGPRPHHHRLGPARDPGADRWVAAAPGRDPPRPLAAG